MVRKPGSQRGQRNPKGSRGRVGKTSSVEDYKLGSSFQALRKTLSNEKYADRLDRPLAFWALPNDRRLPLAFLGRTLADLLATPFEELTATPGIGQKKISSLVKLLSRATKEQPQSISDAAEGSAESRSTSHKPTAAGKAARDRAARNGSAFDPALVSESLWETWRETVRRHGVGFEKLGRLAPALAALPTVIWDTPLASYLDYSVAEIRQLKTHGEKRVRVILEVFCGVHEVLSHSRPQSHLTIRLWPKFVVAVERWMSDCLGSDEIPAPDEVREHLTLPLVEQIKIDAGPVVTRVTEGRLGIHSAPQSVRQQAKRMSITRARVYQLLEVCSLAMRVRWPEGRPLAAALRSKLESAAASAADLTLFKGTLDLFFATENKEED